MVKALAQRLVTGNRLRDGVPIYFSGGAWSPKIDDARLVEEAEAEALLAEAQSGPVPLPVIGPYVIEALAEAGHVKPLSIREEIRAFGPTA